MSQIGLKRFLWLKTFKTLFRGHVISDLKSEETKKTDLANLKSDVNKLDIDKLKNKPSGLSNLKSKADKLDIVKLVPLPVDLSKLSNVVKNDVVKKDASNAKMKDIEDKIPDITNLATKTTFSDKK